MRPEFPVLGKLPIMKSKCKSCPWQTNGHAAELRPGRLAGIEAYLRDGITHICHSVGPDGTTGQGEKHTCKGSVEYMGSVGIHTEEDRVDAIVKAIQEGR